MYYLRLALPSSYYKECKAKPLFISFTLIQFTLKILWLKIQDRPLSIYYFYDIATILKI
ncbi:hypothetical protein H8356DRAFT_1338056 [Neocallimastix lanati (nom. inval.)]|nr:hypothetical protein H8356DRAFT_1338056 [Neocallimastix sp. JGI-2020a]